MNGINYLEAYCLFWFFPPRPLPLPGLYSGARDGKAGMSGAFAVARVVRLGPRSSSAHEVHSVGRLGAFLAGEEGLRFVLLKGFCGSFLVGSVGSEVGRLRG